MLSLEIREARVVAVAIVGETEDFTLYHLGHHHALIQREAQAS